MIFSSLLHFVTKDAFHKIMNLPGSKMEFVDYVVINLIEIVSVFIVSLPFGDFFFQKIIYDDFKRKSNDMKRTIAL